MDAFLLATAATVAGVTALLVRRLVAPVAQPSIGPLTALAVVVSSAALVTAARGAVALALTVAALGVAAVGIAILGTSDHLH